MDEATMAVELFENGCACSQAVLGAFTDRLEFDQDEAMRISAGFAGGMRMGEVCGAVTGAYMALGLAHCTAECTTAEGRKAAYAALEVFNDAFRQRHGSVLCRDLLGCDISTAAGAAIAEEKRLFATICVQVVQDAAQILDETLPSS
jgi:C_GCAxxG_C_C family probable redox protein